MINNSVLSGCTAQASTTSGQLSTQIKSHSCNHNDDPLEQHQADVLPFSLAFASIDTTDASQLSQIPPGLLAATSTGSAFSAQKNATTSFSAGHYGQQPPASLQTQSVANLTTGLTAAQDTSAQALPFLEGSPLAPKLSTAPPSSQYSSAQAVNLSIGSQGTGQAQTNSLSTSSYQQLSSQANSVTPQTSLPQQTGTLKSDTMMSQSLFQAMNSPLQASITDTASVDIVDSVNQILASSTRSQTAVAQWGPVAVSQTAPLLQQAHEMLSPLREQLKFQIDQQIKQAEIRLDPPELGKVELNVRLDGDRLHIQMHAANSSVRDALLMGLDRLRAELAMDHGGQIDVDISQDDRPQKQDTQASDFAIAAATNNGTETSFNSHSQQQDHVDLLA
ncbi:flagellar hook-length control protein FliK [Shewanella pealeana]|uniref:Flagellar hook-length control protein n=1 Tax=Shewanella pealeana (strain ATCC 700345 / ANG-SQ1) TaxID=398579 RepID=A8GYK1_SHEPA|nr:flagellar hook-length control protein FliK [Shewanella pealeana]ABV85388.1 flagellar hook-length control protein [Shewanella pealeana ATCC 700345]